MPVTCGLPSVLIVASQQVWRSGPPPPGACSRPRARAASIRLQSSSGVPYRSARLVASTMGLTVPRGGTHRSPGAWTPIAPAAGLRDMLAHVSIQCSDPAASRAFYEAVLAPLGGKALLTYGEHVGFGQEEAGPDFWIGPVNTPGGPHDDVHIAFAAPTRAHVDAFVDAARAHGAEVLHPPQEWWYRPGYYGGFVRDPDGNNVEAVNLVERATPAARWVGVAVDCADA